VAWVHRDCDPLLLDGCPSRGGHLGRVRPRALLSCLELRTGVSCGLRRLPGGCRARQVDAEAHHGRHAIRNSPRAAQLALMAVDLVLIVAELGCPGRLTLGNRWGVASGLVGTLILGPLTSLPNHSPASARNREARAALVTEALNSNSSTSRRRGAAVDLRRADPRSAQNQLELALLAAATLATVGLLRSRHATNRSRDHPRTCMPPSLPRR